MELLPAVGHPPNHQGRGFDLVLFMGLQHPALSAVEFLEVAGHRRVHLARQVMELQHLALLAVGPQRHLAPVSRLAPLFQALHIRAHPLALHLILMAQLLAPGFLTRPVVAVALPVHLTAAPHLNLLLRIRYPFALLAIPFSTVPQIAVKQIA